MAVRDNYILSRDLDASLRLDCQHLLAKMYTGYTLSPQIPVAPSMKIAEIGTGTGIWLLDLASQLPSTVVLDGFDISDGQFPHESNLPSNVKLSIMDSFDQVPPELVGKYDVVHLRFWVCIVRGNNVEKLIHHAKALLKPGGWIQWEEANLGRIVTNGDEARKFVHAAELVLKSLNFDFGWIEALPNTLESHGLEVVDFKTGRIPPSLVPLIIKTGLAGWFEILDAAYRTQAQSLPPEKETKDILLRLVEALKDGAAYYWTPLSLLARKPAGTALEP
uniref:Methyltransferase domain-containing protein n=1 Tax=Photinus pyralis TaxID=7054 RepID=A0A1Y1KBW6_PHOPY